MLNASEEIGQTAREFDLSTFRSGLGNSNIPKTTFFVYVFVWVFCFVLFCFMGFLGRFDKDEFGQFGK